MDEELVRKFTNNDFYVDADPDYPEFFSVFSDSRGSGCEVAGKIGERCVADAIAWSLKHLVEARI